MMRKKGWRWRGEREREVRIIRNVRRGKVAYKRTESNNNDNCSLPPADHYDPTVIVCDQTIKLAVSDSKIVYLKRGGEMVT